MLSILGLLRLCRLLSCEDVSLLQDTALSVCPSGALLPPIQGTWGLKGGRDAQPRKATVGG